MRYPAKSRLIALALAWSACFGKSAPPPPPASLTAAIAAVDAAVAKNDYLEPSCQVLTSELSAWEQHGKVPVQAKADLHQLGMEVAAYGAMESGGQPGASVDAVKWADLKLRLERVLRGENPRPGSRYQLSMPDDVRAAFDATDAALARGDVPAAEKALGQLRGGISQWSEKMPGARVARMNEAVERFSLPDGRTDRLTELKGEVARLRAACAPRTD